MTNNTCGIATIASYCTIKQSGELGALITQNINLVIYYVILMVIATFVQIPNSFNGSQYREAQSLISDGLKNIDKDSIATVFVEFHKGIDNINASIKYLLKHLDFAIKLVRKKYCKNTYNRIISREGKHYIPKTTNIAALDNNLLVRNYNSEFGNFSGAKAINSSWNKAAGFTNGNNVFSCQINDKTIADTDTLRANGNRWHKSTVY